MRAIDTVCRTAPGLAEVSLRGESGVLHGFTAFPLRDAPCGPAVFLYARPFADLNRLVTPGWIFLGIGETDGMRGRPDIRHARVVEGMTMGATHLLIHFCCRGPGERRLILKDMAGPLKLAWPREPAPTRAA